MKSREYWVQWNQLLHSLWRDYFRSSHIDMLSLKANELASLVCLYKNWILVQDWGRWTIMIVGKSLLVLCTWTRTGFLFFLLLKNPVPRWNNRSLSESGLILFFIRNLKNLYLQPFFIRTVYIFQSTKSF